METLLWCGFFLLLAPVGWYFWPLLLGSTVRGDFIPSIRDLVERVLVQHDGRQVSANILAELQRQVELIVRDTLVDLHRDSDRLVVIVRNDELLGPVCFVQTPDGVERSLADFESRLRS